jgi:hypothetical protein
MLPGPNCCSTPWSHACFALLGGSGAPSPPPPADASSGTPSQRDAPTYSGAAERPPSSAMLRNRSGAPNGSPPSVLGLRLCSVLRARTHTYTCTYAHHRATVSQSLSQSVSQGKTTIQPADVKNVVGNSSGEGLPGAPRLTCLSAPPPAALLAQCARPPPTVQAES